MLHSVILLIFIGSPSSDLLSAPSFSRFGLICVASNLSIVVGWQIGGRSDVRFGSSAAYRYPIGSLAGIEIEAVAQQLFCDGRNLTGCIRLKQSLKLLEKLCHEGHKTAEAV